MSDELLESKGTDVTIHLFEFLKRLFRFNMPSITSEFVCSVSHTTEAGTFRYIPFSAAYVRFDPFKGVIGFGGRTIETGRKLRIHI